MTQPAFYHNVVILTGASRGIGRALALQLAGQGAWLALAARSEGQLEAAAEECRALGQAQGARAIAIPTDVSDQAACRRLVDRTIQEYSRIDTLINNAGQTMWARFEDMTNLTPLETVMRVNYFGSAYCTFAALPFLKQSRGLLVVISSLAGKSGVPTRCGYVASKHAVTGFFETLRIELAPSGVDVTIIFPDFVGTETRLRALGPDGKPLGYSLVQESKVMSAEKCAQIILRVSARRKRQEIMGLRGKIGQWIKLIAPALIDRIALRAIQRGR